MTRAAMRFTEDLQALLGLLGQAGLTIGVAEIARLHAVFASAPVGGEEELRQILEAVLVKSLEERAVFRRAFDVWLGKAQAAMERAEAAHARQRKKDHEIALGVVGFPHLPGAGPPSRRQAEADAEAELAPGAALLMEEEDGLGQKPGTGDELTWSTHPDPLTSSSLAGLGPAQRALVSPPAAAEAGRPQDLVAKSRSMRILTALVAVIVGLCVTYFMYRAIAPTELAQNSGDPDQKELQDAGVATTLRPGREKKPDVMLPEPRISVVWTFQPRSGYFAYGLVLGAVSLCIGIWLTRGRGRFLPQPPPPSQRVTADEARPQLAPTSLFFDAEDEENLVWGVGRFVSDRQSKHLDVQRTVEDTAAAFGRPVLCYEAERYHHEVWLWVDESLNTPVARHLADDLAIMLEASGLPVTRATFWGIPDRLRTSGDELVTIDELDAQRDSLSVAILTDGRLISAAYRTRDRRSDLDSLLRRLSYWPRVTFIDFAQVTGQLSAIAEPYSLRVIKPHDAPAAISDLADSDNPPDYQRLVGDARVWAAACALSPMPVGERTALSLRRLLGLDASPWVIERLRESAVSDAGGLIWSEEYRARLLSWLLVAEELPESARMGKLPASSLLVRVVTAWEQILGARKRAQLARFGGSEDAWRQSPEAKQLMLQRGLITLWVHPDRASGLLYRLYNDGFEDTIRRALSRIAPYSENTRTDGIITMPWELRALRRDTQVMLGEMGFGAAAHMVSRRSMPRPGRLWLAVGLSAGLALGAGWARVSELRTARPPATVRPEGNTPPWAYVPAQPQAFGDESFTIQVATPWAEEPLTSAPFYAGQEAVVSWRWSAKLWPCVKSKTFYGSVITDYQIRRCTTAEKLPPYGFEDGRWSAAVIVADKTYLGSDEYGGPAQGLTESLLSGIADELLDSGSVAVVYWLESADALAAIPWAGLARPGEAGKRDQLLVIVPRGEVLENRASKSRASSAQHASALWNGQPPFPGHAVVLEIDQAGLLSGITDGDAELRPLSERVRRPLAPLSGDPATFLVRGQGSCGELDRRCCKVPEGECSASGSAVGCWSGVCRRLPAARVILTQIAVNGRLRALGDFAVRCSVNGVLTDPLPLGAAATSELAAVTVLPTEARTIQVDCTLLWRKRPIEAQSTEKRHDWQPSSAGDHTFSIGLPSHTASVSAQALSGVEKAEVPNAGAEVSPSSSKDGIDISYRIEFLAGTEVQSTLPAKQQEQTAGE